MKRTTEEGREKGGEDGWLVVGRKGGRAGERREWRISRGWYTLNLNTHTTLIILPIHSSM